jgi:CheY-like chemotaxis protein
MAYLYVIDDDELMGRVLSARLKKKGHRLRRFHRSERALEQLKYDAPDAIVTDLNMPGLDGLSFLRELRRLEIPLPVVIVSSTERCDDVIEAFRLGAVDFLRKPPRESDLDDALEKALRVPGESFQVLDREPVASLMDRVQDGIVVLDRTSRVRLVNRPARELLCLKGEDLQEELDFVIGPGLKGLVRRTLLSPEKHLSMEVPMNRLERPRLVWMDASPSCTPSGEEIGVLVVLRDLSGRGRMERTRSRFLGMVSHEVNTPLTAVKNAMRILETAEDEEEKQRFLKVAGQNLDRLSRLFDRFLEGSRQEMASDVLERTLFRLGDLLQEEELKACLEDGRKLKITAPSRPPVLLGDRRRLHFLIRDLVYRGNREAGSGGEISFEVRTVRRGDPIPGEPEIGSGLASRVWFRLSFAAGNPGDEAWPERVPRVIAEHGGTLWRDDADARSYCFSLPLEPAYDAGADFMNPLDAVKAVAGDMGRAYIILRVEAGAELGRVRPDWHSRLKDCLLQVFPTDMVCRGRGKGEYFIFSVGLGPEKGKAALRRFRQLFIEILGARSPHEERLVRTGVYFHARPESDTTPRTPKGDGGGEDGDREREVSEILLLR